MVANKRKLKEFEKRLLEDKKWLHELTYADDSSDSIYKRKLEHYERELRIMEQQLDRLYTEATGVVRTRVESTSKDYTQVDMLKDKGIRVGTHIAPDGSYVSAETVVDSGQSETKVNMKDILTSDIGELKNILDLEKLIGKSFMGIVASVLIFSAIVAIASLIVPSFTDAIKMILMYGVSLCFLGVGLYKMYKNPEDKFFLTITGCGVGALYISLFLTNIYFKAIGDIALYVLIAIWSVGVCYLSKFKNIMFMIIGNLGITVAMFSGSIMVNKKEDMSMLLALVIFYMISAAMFNIAHYSRDFSKVAFNHIINGINIICLYNAIFKDTVSVASILILLIMFVYLGLILYSEFEESVVVFPLCLATYLGYICAQLDIFVNSAVWGIIIYAICILLVAYIVSKEFEYEITKYITIGIPIIYMVVGLNQSDVVAEHGMAFLIVLPLLIYGFIKNASMLKYSAIAVLFIQQYVQYIECSISYGESEYMKLLASTIERLIVGVLVLVIAFALIYMFKEQYSKIFKYTVHICMFMLLLFVSMQLVNCIGEMTNKDWWKIDGIATQIGFVIATIYNLSMLKLIGTDLDTGEREGHRMYEFLNAFMMLIGTISVCEMYNPVLHILVIMTLVVAFMVKSRTYLEDAESMWPGIYVGAKFVILLVCILCSFEAADFIISIACLVAAIISITIGFRSNYKSLRVFGLVLSMISIFKLIVIDITYNESIGNAFSLLVAGILCFGISMIYNIIEKKVPKE